MKSDDMQSDEGVDTEEATTGELPVTTSGVRISGASPVDGTAAAPDNSAPEEVPAAVDLPHWTDPPTGQVKVAGESEQVTGPTWREDAADWEQDSLAFEASMLVDDQSAVAESHAEKVERQPWDFASSSDDASASALGSFSADAYESIPTEEELFSTLGALSAAAVATPTPA